MRKISFSCVIIIILGLLIAVGPFTFFHVCRPENPEMHMSCYFTARAELGLGIVISILSLLSVITVSSKFRAGLNIAVILNSILVFLIPNFLIGVCSGEHMHCHAVTLPALNILSIVLIIIAVGSFIQFKSNKGKIKNEL